MTQKHRQNYPRVPIVLLVLSAIAAASVKLLWQFNPNLLPIAAFTSTDELQCAEIITPDALLSRERILKLMTIAEGATKAKVRSVLKAPYCKLKPITVRAGATAEREVYPLESDPKIWVIVLYEDDNYVGVRLVPQTQQCSGSLL
ncbi:hypothetical protein IQ250_11900 [Pseudanabaenaceae cyanobacterium LEGE 13415]|nr:hypothetical protein [Pseudanabaenaceae cyanobacterium LEGE 13415]